MKSKNGWKIIRHEVVGISHQKNKTKCQDKTFSKNRRGVAVMALADGVGSCKHSDIGADIVVKAVTKLLSSKFDLLYEMEERLLKLSIINYIYDKFIPSLNKSKKDISEYASTLLFVAVKDDKYIVGHIGDGIICSYCNNIELLSKPENGEFTNSTYTFTSIDVYNHFRIKRDNLGDIKGFFIMSDGTSDSFYSNNVININALTKLYNFINENKYLVANREVKRLLNVDIRTNTTDDCSIGIMTINSKRRGILSKFLS